MASKSLKEHPDPQIRLSRISEVLKGPCLLPGADVGAQGGTPRPKGVDVKRCSRRCMCSRPSTVVPHGRRLGRERVRPVGTWRAAQALLRRPGAPQGPNRDCDIPRDPKGAASPRIDLAWAVGESNGSELTYPETTWGLGWGCVGPPPRVHGRLRRRGVAGETKGRRERGLGRGEEGRRRGGGEAEEEVEEEGGWGRG